MQETQKNLSQNQIEAFYHDDFVKSQVNDFMDLFRKSRCSEDGTIVDIGGGCGFFAKALLAITKLNVRVIDTNLQSINFCKQAGIEAVCGDALNPRIIGDEGVVCFNLILHHLVGDSEDATSSLQMRALSVWHSNVSAIFVNEYIYESFFINNFSGWLIFQITSSSFLSKIASSIARIFPSLKANTFGVGVRFRSHSEWRKMFDVLGFDVVDAVIGRQEGISIPRRLLLIKNCRRDSFWLKPRYLRRDIAKDEL